MSVQAIVELTNLADFVKKQDALLVVVEYTTPGDAPSAEIQPLYEQLAKSSAPIISAFTLNADDFPAIATSAGITSLPTFIFYTTTLSQDGNSLMVVDQVVGPNQQKLKEQFQKGYQVGGAFLAARRQQQQQPSQQSTPIPQATPFQQSTPIQQATSITQSTPIQQTTPTQQAPPVQQSPLAQGPSQQQHQMPPPQPVRPPGRPNDIVKRELVEIRNYMATAIKRIEHLYAQLQ